MKDGWKDGWMNEWMKNIKFRKILERGKMRIWMEGWKDGRMNGWEDESVQAEEETMNMKIDIMMERKHD